MYLVRAVVRLLPLFATFVAVSAGMESAHAEVLTFKLTASRDHEGELDVNLAQFDTALGVLTQVQVSASFFATSALTPSDSCTTDPCDTSGPTESGTLRGSLSLVAGTTTLLSASDSEFKSATCVDTTFDGRSVQCTTPLSVSASDSDTFTDPVVLDWFKGTGKFGTVFKLDASGQLSPIYTDLQGNVSVVYTYALAQTVPEPGSFALAASAGTGLWLSRRRRTGTRRSAR